MGYDPRTPTLRQVREVCTQREPTGRVIIVIVAEREEREEREKEREETPHPPPFPPPSLLPVCRFETLPCVGSKRAHVQNMRAF